MLVESGHFLFYRAFTRRTVELAQSGSVIDSDCHFPSRISCRRRSIVNRPGFDNAASAHSPMQPRATMAPERTHGGGHVLTGPVDDPAAWRGDTLARAVDWQAVVPEQVWEPESTLGPVMLLLWLLKHHHSSVRFVLRPHLA